MGISLEVLCEAHCQFSRIFKAKIKAILVGIIMLQNPTAKPSNLASKVCDRVVGSKLGY